MNQVKKLQTDSVPRLILHLSAPAILSLLLGALNTAIDGMFVAGGVGVTALSAVTVSLGVTLILQGFSLLIAAGTAAALALRLGKNDQAGAERVLGNAFSLALLLTAALTILGLFAARPLLLAQGASADNIAQALEYTRVIIGGSVCFVLAQVANNALKGMGYAKRAFAYFALSVLINTALDFVFIFLFGWGIFGAAFSTVLGNGVCALLATSFLRSKKCIVRLTRGNMALRKASVKAILSIGAPACMMQLALSLAAVAFNHSAARLGGVTATAAYGIVYNMMMLVYMPVMGLGQGIQPLIGLNYSAGQYGRVREILSRAILYASVFSGTMFALILLFSPQIAGAFGGAAHPALGVLATRGLRLFCLTMPAVGFLIISANYFQYAGKIKQAVILSMLRQLILVVPLVFILPASLGLTGMWLATPIADAATFVISLWFIVRELQFLRKNQMQEMPAAA